MKVEVRFYDEDITYEGVVFRVCGLLKTYCLVCEHIWETDEQEQMNRELIHAEHAKHLQAAEYSKASI